MASILVGESGLRMLGIYGANENAASHPDRVRDLKPILPVWAARIFPTATAKPTYFQHRQRPLALQSRLPGKK